MDDIGKANARESERMREYTAREERGEMAIGPLDWQDADEWADDADHIADTKFEIYTEEAETVRNCATVIRQQAKTIATLRTDPIRSRRLAAFYGRPVPKAINVFRDLDNDERAALQDVYDAITRLQDMADPHDALYGHCDLLEDLTERLFDGVQLIESEAVKP